MKTAAHFGRPEHRLSKPSEHRLHRYINAVSIPEASVWSGISTYRISIIERDPAKAKPGELEALRAAVDAIVADREAKS